MKRSHSDSDCSDSEDSEPGAESEEDEDLSEGEIGARGLIREEREANIERIKAQRKAEKKAAKAEANRFVEERQSKVVNLNKLTSISNSGLTNRQTYKKIDDRKKHQKERERKNKKPRRS